MITFPKTIEQVTEASKQGGVLRAGSTELTGRRQSGLSREPLIDLRDLEGCEHIYQEKKCFHIGSLARIAQLAKSKELQAHYSGLSKAAKEIASPHIREVATLGGNLMQHNRCWYYRSTDFHCFKKGGATCTARSGDHHLHSCFDQGPCIAPHPSTLAMALLAYGAKVVTNGSKQRKIEAFLGDGSDPTKENAMNSYDFISEVLLPIPIANEKTAYVRATSRAHAEWPLVEALVRIVLEEDKITFVRVVAGGVANTPLRLKQVESILIDQELSKDLLRKAAKAATEGANPLPGTTYKVEMLVGTILEALEQATSEV